MAQQERSVTAVSPERVKFFTDLMIAEGFTVTAALNPDGSTNLHGVREISEDPAPPVATGLQKIAWGKKVSTAFKQKLLGCCGRLGVNPDFLMAAMAFETGGTFDPRARNATSGATGLIQFMPRTAEGLGTTVEALSQMTAVEQLDFVEAHFQPFTNKLQTIEDTYMAILLPSAVGKPNDHVLFAQGSVAYTQNRPLDHNNDGEVTKEEAAAFVRQRLDQGRTEQFFG